MLISLNEWTNISLWPCLLPPSSSIIREIVLDLEIWVVCIFMIKADDIFMVGQKIAFHWLLSKGIPFHLWDLPNSLSNLGGRTWRLPPLTIYLRSRQTVQKRNYQIFFIAVSWLESWLTQTNWDQLYKAHIPYLSDKTLLVNTAIHSFTIEFKFYGRKIRLRWIRCISMDKKF